MWPFDGLRANGRGGAGAQLWPFVVSLSNHGWPFDRLRVNGRGVTLRQAQGERAGWPFGGLRANGGEAGAQLRPFVVSLSNHGPSTGSG